MNALARSVIRASTAVACLVVLIDEEADVIRLVGSHGVPEGYEAAMQAVYNRAGEHSPTREAIRTHKPVVFRDARRTILANPRLAPIRHFYEEDLWDTFYIVPLLFRGRALGTINFGYPRGQEPGEEEKVFLKAVSDQAAVALENARL
jgi:GAF domain-containing protein